MRFLTGRFWRLPRSSSCWPATASSPPGTSSCAGSSDERRPAAAALRHRAGGGAGGDRAAGDRAPPSSTRRALCPSGGRRPHASRGCSAGRRRGGRQVLPEGGEAVGRVGAAVNRLAQRLREERARTRAQIEALESANRQIREAREEVARSERLASVGRLAAGVAHEVGNPVTALIAYSALMRERLQQGKDVKEYAERVEREATRIDRILRDLL